MQVKRNGINILANYPPPPPLPEMHFSSTCVYYKLLDKIRVGKYRRKYLPTIYPFP